MHNKDIEMFNTSMHDQRRPRFRFPRAFRFFGRWIRRQWHFTEAVGDLQRWMENPGSLMLLLVLTAGCTRQDARLEGTWHSNRDATVAAAFQRDPRWTNAPAEKVELFRGLFGQMTITYSKGSVRTDCLGVVASFSYRVLESGSNFVVIHSDAPLDKGRDIHIRFVDGDSGFWIDTGPLGGGIEERFNKVKSD
jgi:hypothetical protein